MAFCLLSIIRKQKLKQCKYSVDQSALLTRFPTDFTSPVWNFCRWVADVIPREASSAAKSEEKRLFSQANWKLAMRSIKLLADITFKNPLKRVFAIPLTSAQAYTEVKFCNSWEKNSHVQSQLKQISFSYAHKNNYSGTDSYKKLTLFFISISTSLSWSNLSIVIFYFILLFKVLCFR